MQYRCCHCNEIMDESELDERRETIEVWGVKESEYIPICPHCGCDDLEEYDENEENEEEEENEQA